MRRVVVTGMGAVTPIGIGVENFWNSVKEKRTGFDKITKFDTTGFKASLAAEIKDFDPKEFIEAGMLMLYPSCPFDSVTRFIWKMSSARSEREE